MTEQELNEERIKLKNEMECEFEDIAMREADNGVDLATAGLDMAEAELEKFKIQADATRIRVKYNKNIKKAAAVYDKAVKLREDCISGEKLKE